MENMRSTVKVPVWFWISAVLGLLWNAFGVYQYLGTTGATAESLAAMGMTPEQIALQTSLPAWMIGAFAIAVFGGLAGCILLLLRKAWATPVFALSLLGCIGVFAGDAALGVYSVFGMAQAAIISTVVIIAVLLLWLSTASRRRGILN